MDLRVQYQERYSRKQLLLRTFFGWLYIAIPHFVLIYIYMIWVYLLQIINWFYILFTGQYLRPAYSSYVGLWNWLIRVEASLNNLVDGYPPFGPSTKWEKAHFSIGYPSVVSRKRLLFITFLGWLVLIPHFIVLYILALIAVIGTIIAWFVVLFTGKYPESIHQFYVSVLVWQSRVSMYASFLYFSYPEFTGELTERDKQHA